MKRKQNLKICVCACLFMINISLPFVDADGSCKDHIYLEVGKQGLVSCDFENFILLGWINREEEQEAENPSPFIYLEGSEKQGRGYEKGDYDILPNGSLVINHVTMENELEYTALFVPPLDSGGNQYIQVQVNVYVRPIPDYPVVNGITNQRRVILDVTTEGHINCSMVGIRHLELEWDFSPDVISLHSVVTTVNNTDGTSDTSINSNFTILSRSIDRVTLHCRVGGQLADLFPVVTTIDLLLWKTSAMIDLPIPAIDGCYSQPDDCTLTMQRDETLVCFVTMVPQLFDLNLRISIFERDGIFHTYNIMKHNSSSVVNEIIFGHYSKEKRSTSDIQCSVYDWDTHVNYSTTVTANIVWQDSYSTWGWNITIVVIILLFLIIGLPIYLRTVIQSYVKRFLKGVLAPGNTQDHINEHGSEAPGNTQDHINEQGSDDQEMTEKTTFLSSD